MDSVYERRVWSGGWSCGRAEIERLAGLYQTSGMGRSEFCRSHGMALSTLNRYLKNSTVSVRCWPRVQSGVEP
jgi:hypothetical protein